MSSKFFTQGQAITFIEKVFDKGRLSNGGKNISVVCPMCKSVKNDRYEKQKLVIRTDNFNTKNNKIYIGRAVCLRRRYLRHLSNLFAKKYRNKYLEREYWKYGEDVFEFALLKHVPKDKLVIVEQQYLNKLKPLNGKKTYNLTLHAEGPGNCLTEYSKMKISQTLTGRRHSKNRIEKIKKSCAWRKKQIKLMSPNGKLVKINGIVDFCKEYNLARSGIAKVINGKRLHYKRWCLSKNYDIVLKNQGNVGKNKLKRVLLSPQGVSYEEIRNIRDFSKQKKLSYSRFCMLLREEITEYKGWRYR